jgi:hypothetical protein
VPTDRRLVYCEATFSVDCKENKRNLIGLPTRDIHMITRTVRLQQLIQQQRVRSEFPLALAVPNETNISLVLFSAVSHGHTSGLLMNFSLTERGLILF